MVISPPLNYVIFRTSQKKRGMHPAASYFLLANNAAVIVIASLYQEDNEAFMRKISDQTILLAAVLFLSFGLIAYFSN